MSVFAVPDSNTVFVAALYRVSTTKQLKDEEDSIPVQKSVIKEYISSRPGWVLAAEYAEEGVSAYRLGKEDRDVLRQVFADAASGKFSVLLVFKADRLSRQSFEYPLVLWQLQRLGVEVIAVADAPGGKILKMEDQMDKLVRFIEGWQAETESKNTSIRVSSAMRELTKKGCWTGGRPPYGFKLNSYKGGLPLEIDPHEKSVLELMVQLYEEGMGSKRIANRLNELGFTTREGRPWKSDRVRGVLQNPIIAGLPAYGRTVRKGPTTQVRIKGYTDLEKFIVPRDENGNPKPIPEYTIIPLEKWLWLMGKMKSNMTGGPGRGGSPTARALNGKSLLTGFLVCGYCGRGFMVHKWRTKTKRKDGTVSVRERMRYHCSTHAKVGNGRNYCSGPSNYSQKKIDGIFLEELKTFLESINPKDFELYLEQVQSSQTLEVSARVKRLEAELRKRRKIYSEWVSRLDAYFADPGSSLYNEEFLAAKIKEHGEACKAIEAEIGRLQSEIKVVKCRKDQLKEFSKKVPHWLDAFMEAPTPVKKRMLSHIIKKIVLYKDRIEIHYCVDIADFLGKEAAAGESGRIELRVVHRGS